MTPLAISEIAAHSPEMSGLEFAALVEDIRANGQLIPIWKCGDEIIDGRKRLRACVALGIKPRTIDLSPGQDPTALAHSLNILRTHYTQSQRAMYAAKRATLKRGAIGGGRKADVEISTSALTAERAGKLAGVSRDAVMQAKALRRDAVPEVVAAVEAGSLTLHSAGQIAKTATKEEQPTIVARVIEASRGKARHTSVTTVLGKKRFKSVPLSPLAGRIERGIDQLETAVELLTAFVAEDDKVKSAHWLKRLCKARTGLSRVIDSLRGRA